MKYPDRLVSCWQRLQNGEPPETIVSDLPSTVRNQNLINLRQRREIIDRIGDARCHALGNRSLHVLANTMFFNGIRDLDEARASILAGRQPGAAKAVIAEIRAAFAP